jgi:hypothetical protein
MRRHSEIVLKVLALFMPFYIIYYWRLHNDPEKPFTKSLWGFTIAGFCIYIILTILYINFE